MEINAYQSQAMRTLNPALKKEDVLLNSLMGLCGESGEAIDILKKHLSQGHPLDEKHLEEELGGIAWYLSEAATALGMNLDDILRANIEKLQKRYPQGFSAKDSLERKI
jgi:NTP pyrophosphatase (non-canonical NTP hydrolase)